MSCSIPVSLYFQLQCKKLRRKKKKILFQEQDFASGLPSLDMSFSTLLQGIVTFFITYIIVIASVKQDHAFLRELLFFLFSIKQVFYIMLDFFARLEHQSA